MVAFEFILILVGLFIVATLYSSVGHGGASGYLAILSLSSYGILDTSWVKQYAWCMNMIVAFLAFWHYQRQGHHIPKLTLPFILSSVPFAVLGGYLLVDGMLYDFLLSIALVWAAWRLYQIQTESDDQEEFDLPGVAVSFPAGGLIGFVSGIIGVGGGIFLSPLIMLKKWASPKSTAATSALFILINSAAALMGASISNQIAIDLTIIGPFAVSVLIGGLIGSIYGARIAPQRLVRRLLVIVLIIAASRRVIDLLIISFNWINN